VDYTDQDWFINRVIKVGTDIDPLPLMERLQAVQQALGRTAPAVRFGPRVLDLDILLYDRLVFDDPRLSIPHPRMHTRRFVLMPLCDIDPEVVHPVLGKAARTLLSELGEEGQEVVEYRCSSD
jgi:2-amino-4-hydroxy-6-hydroxymethyldihydropteridine diphosphokinase